MSAKQERAALAAMLAIHPAPWRCAAPDAVGDYDVVDANDRIVSSVSGEDEDPLFPGIVAAVNLTAQRERGQP